MTAKNKNDILEKAKFISLLEKKYKEAIKLLDHFLVKHRNDLDALRLKGNILDLKGLDSSVGLKETEIESCFTEALKCYYAILFIDNQNANAMIDIGDYWERKNDCQEALRWYNLAIDALEKVNNNSVLEELDETIIKRQKILELLSKEKSTGSEFNLQKHQ